MVTRTPKVELQPRDELLGSRLNYHGALTRKQLQEYDDEPSARGFQMRLGDLKKAGYVYDPIKTTKKFIPFKTEPATYANTPLFDDYLIKKGITHRRSQKLSGDNLAHERFLSSTTHSVEIGCLERNWKYRFETQLIAKSPTFSRKMPCNIEYLGQVRTKHGWKDSLIKSDEALVPDAYFGIDNGRLTAYFLEVDRKKEPIWRSTFEEESWRSKLLKYIKVMDSGSYKTHLGLPSNTPALCLFVFNDLDRMEAVQKEVLHLTKDQGRPYFLFQTWSEFSDPTFIPKEVNYSFTKDAWYRCGHDRAGKPHAPIYL
jgi:hypothetical protein